MNVDAAVATLRGWLDDESTRPLYSTARIEEAVKASAAEVAERTFCVLDTETITTEAGTAEYSVSAPMIRLDRALLDGTPLRPRSIEWLDQYRAGWESSDHAGTTSEYVEGRQTIRLVPAPDAAGTLILHFARTLSDDESLEVIPERYHLHMLRYAQHYLLLAKDPDIENPQRADRALAQFERVFGSRKSAQWEIAARTLRGQA